MPTHDRYFLLHNKFSLGDVVVSTALMRDIKAAYGDSIKVSFRSNTMYDLVAPAPYIDPLDKSLMPQEVSLASGRRVAPRLGIDISTKHPQHYLKAYYQLFEYNTGIHVPITELKPDLHVSTPNPRPDLENGSYWVVATGGKRDIEAKIWSPTKWGRVFDLAEEETFLRVGSLSADSIHHPIEHRPNVIDVRSRTTVCQLAALIRDCKGVVCGVTSLMHIAAAFDKPCVVIAGAREPWWWEAYTDVTRRINGHKGPKRLNQTYLHTIGDYECCSHGACWRSWVRPKSVKNKLSTSRLCKDIVEEDILQPKCLTAIQPEHIISAMNSYETEKGESC